MSTQLLDLVFPKRSPSGREGSFLSAEECRRVEAFLQPVKLDEEMLRKKGLKHLDLVVAAGNYSVSPVLRRAILTFKFGRIPELHATLAGWMTNAIPGLLLEENAHLVPVPLHWTRSFWRGFNQSELLAKNVGAAVKWPVSNLLKRTRPTGHQTRRTREKRMTALIDAFEVHSHAKNDLPYSVVLIDDLCTTGATLDECAKALKHAGVERVSALVIAYG